VAAEPGDQGAAGAGGGSHLIASQADRDQVLDALKAAFVQGRLTKDEFDQRVGQVLATYAELDALTADIPARPTEIRPPEPARESHNRKVIQRGTAAGAGDPGVAGELRDHAQWEAGAGLVPLRRPRQLAGEQQVGPVGHGPGHLVPRLVRQQRPHGHSGPVPGPELRDQHGQLRLLQQRDRELADHPAESAPTLTAAGTYWHQADVQIMSDATIVPILDQNFAVYSSARVRGIASNGQTYPTPIFAPNIGAPDITALWLAGS